MRTNGIDFFRYSRRYESSLQCKRCGKLVLDLMKTAFELVYFITAINQR